MAKNRRHIDKAEKKQEVIAIAKKCFMNEGYYETSMAKVAQLAGIAPNTIYWYFRGKDELLAEVINSTVTAKMEAFRERINCPLEDNVWWVLERLTELRPLAIPLHHLMQTSEIVAQTHDNFHRLTKAWALHFLTTDGLQREDAENLVAIWEHVLEGLLLHSASEAERKKVCDFLLTLSLHYINRT